MGWIATATPLRATFLVVAPVGNSAGSESEWFPVIANRKSLGTYQGLEWICLPRPGHRPGNGTSSCRVVEHRTSLA